MATNKLPVFDRHKTANLLEAVAMRRDENAFKRLLEIFAGPMKLFLINLGTDVQIAEEIVQDVMATVWLKASQYSRNKGSVSTWLFTIAKNRRIDLLLKDQTQVNPSNTKHFDEREVEWPDSIVHRILRNEKVRVKLAELPTYQRQVLVKGVYEDKSHEQISSELDVPLGTVKSRRRLAFDRLRENLADEILL